MSRDRTIVAAGALALAAMLAPARAWAQRGSGDGFLFQRPTGSLVLKGGFDHPLTRSDIFTFTTDQLTVNRSDFNAFTGGLDFNVRIAPRFDLVVGGSYAGSKTPSEFRDFVDQNNLPIQQTTKFQRVPLTLSLKAYLVPPGRSFGRFAWVPSRVAPWIGVGGGAEWYKFEQSGDFVDFQTNDVYSDVYSSTGWSPEAHAMAGVDVSLSPRFFVTGEGRYSWAKTSMSNDFAGFNKIDLSGLSATVGLGVRF